MIILLPNRELCIHSLRAYPWCNLQDPFERCSTNWYRQFLPRITTSYLSYAFFVNVVKLMVDEAGVESRPRE